MQITLYNISIIYLIIIGAFLIYVTNILNKIYQFLITIKLFYQFFFEKLINFIKKTYYLSINKLIDYPKGIDYILNDGFGLSDYDVYKLKFNKKINTYFSYKIKYKYKYIHLYFSNDEKWYIYIPSNNTLFRVKTNYYNLLKIINPILYTKLTNNLCQ